MTESKKSASKRAASNTEQDKATEDQPTSSATTEGTSPEGGEQQPAQTGRPEDSGPGTGREAPPEDSARPPAGLMNTEATASGPLEPPTDVRAQTDPQEGHSESTTDNVYAAAGGRTVAGEDYSRLVDADGNDLSADALFDDSDASKTFVTAKTRIYEEFYYPNTNQPAKRLMFAEGRRVPRAQAENIKTAVDSAPEPAAASRQGGESK